MQPLVEPGPLLSAEQAVRYARHLILPQIGETGQRRLLAARVAVVGAGGLGSPALAYLAAAGIGTIGLIEDDVVELSNLQRQVLHGVADVGRRKLDSATEQLAALSPETTVVGHAVRLTDANARALLSGYDLVLDGTDTFPTRYAVADACADLGVPLVWGSVLGFDAQLSVFWPTAAGGTTLRDLFPEPPPQGSVPSCAQAGVLGSLTGQLGAAMATEAIKLITGAGEPALGRVLVLDALTQRWREVPLRPRERRTSAPSPAPAPAAAPAPQAHSARAPEIDAGTLRTRLDAREPIAVVDVREDAEVALGTIPGSLHLPLALALTGQGRARIPDADLVVLFCARGPRAHRAAAELGAHGRAVAVLAGGYPAWAGAPA